MSASHAKCRRLGRHVCQVPSGRTCIEEGCNEAAGTLWGPLWCPEHDQERLDRIDRQFVEIAAAMNRSAT